ncbi:MAG: hypothetical protein JW737_04420 [Acidobacteria bacterium]|nr:hypothetical protein [Acidobacteriota bacterium]
MADLIHNPIFTLFLIIGTGILIGKIRFGSFSFGAPAILLVAFFFGHCGCLMPEMIRNFGLVLFIYTIGLQAAPTFFTILNKRAVTFIIISLTVVSFAAVFSATLSTLFGIDKALTIGIFNGALTSTPGLAVGIEALGSEEVSLGYGIAYPVGLLIITLFIQILVKLPGFDPKKEEKKYKDRLGLKPVNIYISVIKAQNTAAIGKSFADLNLSEKHEEVTVSRVKRGASIFTPDSEYKIRKGDLLKVVGTESGIKTAQLIIGEKTDEDIPASKNIKSLSLIVTNRMIIGKSLGSLRLRSMYGANVTRLSRNGVEIPASHDFVLSLGDKVRLACPVSSEIQVKSLFGNALSQYWANALLPISIGIVVGFLLGQVRFELPGIFSFKLGATGGPLISGLIFGRLIRTGPVMWAIPYRATTLLREMSLAMFLTAVGTSAGSIMVKTLKLGGVKMLLISAATTLTALVFTALIFSFLVKIDRLSLMGALSGGMTSSSSLGAVASTVETNIPQTVLAQVFPFALIWTIIINQILVMLL